MKTADKPSPTRTSTSSRDARCRGRRDKCITSLYTIGHGAVPFEAFLGQVVEFEIQCLVDVRRFPGSRRHPHFSRENLDIALPQHGIAYVWMPELGGRRRAEADSPNIALRNDAFRAYADYMATPEFVVAADALLVQAAERRTAIMCSETLWWRCHRRLIADWASARGTSVEHLLSGKAVPHQLTLGLRPGTDPLRYDEPSDLGL